VTGDLAVDCWRSFCDERGDRGPRAGRWGFEVVLWLHIEHLGLPGYTWAQCRHWSAADGRALVWFPRRLADTAPDADGQATLPAIAEWRGRS
jgi:hypothetical protein